MIDPAIRRDRRVIGAASLLAVGVVALLFSFVRAMHLSATPPLDAPAPVVQDALAAGGPSPAFALDIGEVVDGNLFAPDRSAPLAPYRLRQEQAFEEYAGDYTAEPEPLVLPVVHGTAVAAEGRSFAMCSLGGAPSQVVRVGDRVGEFTVRTISRGEVEFSAPSGERFSVTATSSSVRTFP